MEKKGKVSMRERESEIKKVSERQRNGIKCRKDTIRKQVVRKEKVSMIDRQRDSENEGTTGL